MTIDHYYLFRLKMILKGILVLVLRARPRKLVAFEHDYEDDNEEEIVSESTEMGITDVIPWKGK